MNLKEFSSSHGLDKMGRGPHESKLVAKVGRRPKLFQRRAYVFVEQGRAPTKSGGPRLCASGLVVA